MPNIVTNVKWTDNTRDLARNLTTGLDTIGRSANTVRQQIRETSQSVKDLQKAIKDYGSSASAVALLTPQLESAKAAHAALKRELADLEPKAKSAASALKTVGDEAKATATGLQTVGETAKSAGEQAAQAGANFRQTASALSTLGRGLTAAVTVPIVGAAAASLKFASEFESDMVKVSTLSNITEESMQRMRAAVLQLAPTVGIGPDALAKALIAVTSTGLDGAKAIDVLTISAKASAVGLGDATVIARTITSIIRAYGEENITAAKAAEIMFKIVKDGNADAAELAGSLGRVVGIASTLKISLEDIGTFIATFTRIGVNTAEAVTAVRGIIGALELKKPSDDAIQALQSVGLTFDALRAKIRDVGLTAAALDLFSRFKGRENDLQPIIANIRALAGAMGTYGAQASDVIGIQSHMVKQTHELADAFGRTKQTSTQQWNELTAQLQVLAITIGNELLPAFNRLLENTIIPGIKTVEGFVAVWRDLPVPVQQFTELVVGLGVAGGPVLLALVAVARAIASIQLLLFGANTAAATSVAAWLAKLGLGGAAAGGAAAAEGGAAAAEGAGLAALQRKLGWGLPRGLPGLGALATGGFLLGNSGMSLSGADAEKAKAEIQEWLSRAFIESLPKAPKPVDVDRLFPGGKPPDIGATGIIFGTRIEDVIDAAAAFATVAERVKALTAAQRDDILSKHAQGEATKDIARETGIAANVVAAFLKQQQMSSGAAKKFADAWAELNSLGATYRETLKGLSDEQVGLIEDYLKQGASVDLVHTALSGLGGEWTSLTKLQVQAVSDQIKSLDKIIARMNDFEAVTVSAAETIGKSFGGQTILRTLNQQTEGISADLMTILNNAFKGLPTFPIKFALDSRVIGEPIGLIRTQAAEVSAQITAAMTVAARSFLPLTEEQKHAIEQMRRLGFTTQEIAVIMGLSVDQVATRLERFGSAIDVIAGFLQDLRSISEQTFTNMRDRVFSALQAVLQLIQQVVRLQQEIRTANALALISQGLGIGLTVGTILLSFIAKGGVVGEHGVQHFIGGGMAQPFMQFARRGSDTVPAMLTPGEMVLNASQQTRLFQIADGRIHDAVFRSEGATVVHQHTHNWDLRQAVVTNEQGLDRLARAVARKNVQHIAQNKASVYTGGRAAYGLRS